jgi:hypothetical protein
MATTIMSKREKRRQAAGILPRQPVPRKTRDDAAADQRDQKHHDGDAGADGIVRRTAEMRFEMKAQVPRDQQRHQQHHGQIAPVLAGEDFTPGRRNDQRQKGRVDDQRDPPGGLGGKRDRQPSRNPDQDQYEQGHAANRQPPGPVRNRGEQKTRDRRRQIAVEHFVDVPVARHKG